MSIELWPGRPCAARRELGRRRGELLAVLGGGHARRGLSVRCRRAVARGRALRPAREHGSTAGTATCPSSRRGRRTGIACTARGSPRAGSAVTPASCSSTRTPRPCSGTCRGTRRRWASSGARPTSTWCSTARDSAPFVPRSLIVDEPLRLGGRSPAGARPGARPSSTSCTCAGFTRLHPDIPEALRGTYAGLAHPARHRAPHARSASPPSSFSPCTSRSTTPSLIERGLTNYWGYNTLGFFAPAQRYASGRAPGAAVREFKAMVKVLHAAGLEVLLDVVYNHTCESDRHGPTLSLKGVDNATLLRARARRPAQLPRRHGLRQHGARQPSCRGTLDRGQPALLGQRDARGWLSVRPGHRARPRRGRRSIAPTQRCFRSSRRTRCCSRAKLIAEPWDLGPEATSWARSRRRSPSGTTSTAMACGASGAATRQRPASSPRASAARRTSTRARAGRPTPASTT